MLVLLIAGCADRSPPAGASRATPPADQPAARFSVSFTVQPDPESPPDSIGNDAPQPDAPEIGAPTDSAPFGSIAGVVKWNGPLPTLDRVPVPTDGHACAQHGQHDRAAESLIVDPAHGGVKDAVVHLVGKLDDARPLDTLDYPGTLNQRHCSYEPRVSILPVGARLTMTSEDEVGHNIRMSGAAELNIAISKGARTVRRIDQPGVVRVGCDIHPWMTGYIHVVRQPYYQVTGADGRFELSDAPAGEHELRLWHEAWWMEDGKLASPIVSTHRVRVRPGQTTHVTFTLSGR